jgi:hypothetical protein
MSQIESQIEQRDRQRIETWLGRPLTDAELVPVPSLSALSNVELDVVKVLAARQRTACISYLLTIVVDPPVRDILLFLHQF